MFVWPMETRGGLLKRTWKKYSSGIHKMYSEGDSCKNKQLSPLLLGDCMK